MNVFTLFANAVAAWGQRIAVRYGERRWSYRELDAAAAAFAGHLGSLGLVPGDRVALFMKNGPAYPAALLGAFRGGYVAVPINAKLHPREAAYIIENSQAKAALVDADQLDNVKTASPEACAFISTRGALDAILACAHGEVSSPIERDPDDLAWLFYTSGTTGKPKGAMLSHRNLIAMSVNCLADICAFRPDDRLLHATPLSHGSGLYLNSRPLAWI